MEIEYLTLLQDNPTKGSLFRNEPITETEIAELEFLFNDGRIFPAALRELLYLAGAYCTVLDYGSSDNQKEIQQRARIAISRENKVLNRNFYVIEVLNDFEQFLLVYLDEEEDPEVQSIFLTDNQLSPRNINLKKTLSQLCNDRIQRLIQGESIY